MTIARDSAHSEWLCTAERPGGHSYLFFEEFKLQVKGAELQQVTAEASFTGTLLIVTQACSCGMHRRSKTFLRCFLFLPTFLFLALLKYTLFEDYFL